MKKDDFQRNRDSSPDKTVPRHGVWRQFPDRFEDSSPTLFEDSSPTLLFSHQKCQGTVFKSVGELSSNLSGNCLQKGVGELSCRGTVLFPFQPCLHFYQNINLKGCLWKKKTRKKKKTIYWGERLKTVYLIGHCLKWNKPLVF